MLSFDQERVYAATLLRLYCSRWVSVSTVLKMVETPRFYKKSVYDFIENLVWPNSLSVKTDKSILKSDLWKIYFIYVETGIAQRRSMLTCNKNRPTTSNKYKPKNEWRCDASLFSTEKSVAKIKETHRAGIIHKLTQRKKTSLATLFLFYCHEICM